MQSVLWSDSRIFAEHPEAVGNAMMFLMTAFALKKASGMTFQSPTELLGELLPEVLAYGKAITAHPALRTTFALNSLVAVDNAAWLLYSQERVIDDFAQLVPASCREALSFKHQALAYIPLMT